MTNKNPARPMNVPKILFVCSGNTCRSPMAQALFLHRNRYRAPFFPVESCGIAAVDRCPMSPLARRALEDFGIVDFFHWSRSLESENPSEADLIFCLAWTHLDHVARHFPSSKNLFLLREFLDGQSIRDPFGSSLESYRSVGRLIAESLASIEEFLQPIYRSVFSVDWGK